MIYGYCRVSTVDQNPQLQIDALTAAGAEEIYVDRISGSKVDRPQLGKMLARLRSGDVVMIWKLDRLGRSMMHLCEIVTSFIEREVGFKVLTQPIDTTTAGGKLCFHVFAAMAEFERTLIRERTVEGIRVARANGKQIGRQSQLSPFVREQFDRMLMEPHIKVREIAEHLGINIWSAYQYAKQARARWPKRHLNPSTINDVR